MGANRVEKEMPPLKEGVESEQERWLRAGELARKEGRMRQISQADRSALVKRVSKSANNSDLSEDQRVAVLKEALLDGVKLGFDLDRALLEPQEPLALRAMLELGAKNNMALTAVVEGFNYNKRRAFEWQSQSALLTTLEAMLAAGFDPNWRDEMGRTTLHHACMANAPFEAFSLLVNAGASFEAQSAVGKTPRDYALGMLVTRAIPSLEKIDFERLLGIEPLKAPEPSAEGAAAPKRARL